MKKLVDLLQSVLTQRRDVPPARSDDAGPPTSSPLPHPLSAFAKLQKRLPSMLNRKTSPQQTAAILASAFDAYTKEALRPWIASNCRSSSAGDAIENLIPKSDAELVGYLIPQPTDPSPFTPADILKQIEGELADAIQAINSEVTHR